MADMQTILEQQRSFFAGGATRDIRFRAAQLFKLKRAILKHESDIFAALKKDLGKTEFEAYETELGFVLEELGFTLRKLSGWARPKNVYTPIKHFPSQSTVYKEPYGVVLVMSPWNYPFQLAMVPLIGAMAAGNTAVVKPSEYSKHTAEVIETIVRETFEPGYITVVRGGREANRSLLHEKFDYIFFTGSVGVGKFVMESAAKHLTPVTLELGGKSPCIVDETANLRLAARRIVWGKYLNAGQTCVAPDYVLVHNSVKDELLSLMGECVTRFYGENPLQSEELPKIINKKHFERLLGLMENETVVVGGRWDEAALKIEPTVLTHATWNSPVMQEEIFGPVLPVLGYDDLKEAAAMVNSHPKPLALYLFTRKKSVAQYVIRNVSFGGGCVNDTVIHLANPHLQFGGVGESGMGGYHGKASFDTFSHKKSVTRKSNLLDIPLRYPPFKDHLKLLRLFMR